MKTTKTVRMSRKQVVALACEVVTPTTKNPKAQMLRGMSRRLADVEAEDDLVQEMALVLIERADDLTGKSASYVSTRCLWSVQHREDIGRERVKKLLFDDPMPLTEDDDEIDLLDIIPDVAAASPEDILIAKEEAENQHQIVEYLRHKASLHQDEIMGLMLKGMTQADIARKFKCSQPAIKQTLNKLLTA